MVLHFRVLEPQPKKAPANTPKTDHDQVLDPRPIQIPVICPIVPVPAVCRSQSRDLSQTEPMTSKEVVTWAESQPV